MSRLAGLKARLPTAWKRPFRRVVDRSQAIVIDPWLGMVQRRLYAKPYVHGTRERIRVGRGVSLMNTVLNTASGSITIGDNTIFGHNCMVLTGRHDFSDGRRKNLAGGGEVPRDGHDISIGSGCWIASGVIITGSVTIGDDVIVAAGAVVTKDVPSGSMVGGVPARPL